MRKEIPIFFSFDDNYVVPAAVAFYSLLIHAKEHIFYKMYVLHADITEENQQLLLELVGKCGNGHLEFRNTDGFLQEEWQNGSFVEHKNIHTVQFTADTIVRCFAARFFPEYDTIIYSDVDIVVMDDISELFDINLTDRYVAGAKNPFTKCYDNNWELEHLSEEHYEKLKDVYIIGSIWVLNLSNIRKDMIEERMLEIIHDDTIRKKWNDQDIINIACMGKITHISLRYISTPFIFDLLAEKNFAGLYTKEEIIDSILHPKILHFAGKKPWTTNINCGDIWWNYFKILNLPTTKLIPDDPDKRIKKAKFKYRIYYKLWKRLDKILKKKGWIRP